MQNTQHFRLRAAALGLLGLLGALGAAHADGPPVQFQFSIGNAPPPVVVAQPAYAPPPVVYSAPPSMVWTPEVSAYIALGSGTPMFYVSGLYYVVSGGVWYASPGYDGPWRRSGMPPGQLRHFEHRDWDRYQDMARRHAGEPGWREFRPGRGGREEGPPGRGPGEHGRGPGWERGRGGPPGWDR